MKGKDSTVTLDSVLWDGTELLIMTTRTFEKEVGMDDKPWLGVDISLNGEFFFLSKKLFSIQCSARKCKTDNDCHCHFPPDT